MSYFYVELSFLNKCRHEEDFFVVDGLYEKNERNEKVIVSLKRGQKKIIKRNGKAYDRFSDHIGFLPLVIISPTDRDLIIERKWHTFSDWRSL